MPRAVDPNKAKAKELYLQGYKLKDIASELNVSEGTVRSWKNRYKWDKCNATQKECNVALLNATKKEIKEVDKKGELNEKQRLFCLYYAKSFNATQSYLKAYGGSYNNAMVSGSQALRNPKIKAKIMKLKEERYAKAFLRTEDIFQKYMDIAFADVADYVDWGMDVAKGDDGKEYKYNYLHFKNSNEVDSSIISEVAFSSQGGAKIKLADRLKALNWLAEHMNMATEEQKLKIDKLKKELKTDDDSNEVVQIVDDID